MRKRDERSISGIVIMVAMGISPFVLIAAGIWPEARGTIIMVSVVVLGVVFLAGGTVWVISTGVRSGLAQREDDVRERSPQPAESIEPSGGFPISPSTSPTAHFLVIGISKATAEDVTLQIEAATPANAKAKAELQGVVVTEVREITG
jgi:hypothetical protein